MQLDRKWECGNQRQWVAFGGHGVIAENGRDEQRKIMKYNHLVANCLIFHNVQAMTQALHELGQASQPVEADDSAKVEPLPDRTH
jgi:TnpA family transposase